MLDKSHGLWFFNPVCFLDFPLDFPFHICHNLYQKWHRKIRPMKTQRKLKRCVKMPQSLEGAWHDEISFAVDKAGKILYCIGKFLNPAAEMPTIPLSVNHDRNIVEVFRGLDRTWLATFADTDFSIEPDVQAETRESVTPLTVKAVLLSLRACNHNLNRLSFGNAIVVWRSDTRAVRRTDCEPICWTQSTWGYMFRHRHRRRSCIATIRLRESERRLWKRL